MFVLSRAHTLGLLLYSMTFVEGESSDIGLCAKEMRIPGRETSMARHVRAIDVSH